MWLWVILFCLMKNTLNVNSVRARISNILSYINQFKPEILPIQEIKTQDENYPYEELKIGYESYVFGQKA